MMMLHEVTMPMVVRAVRCWSGVSLRLGHCVTFAALIPKKGIISSFEHVPRLWVASCAELKSDFTLVPNLYFVFVV